MAGLGQGQILRSDAALSSPSPISPRCSAWTTKHRGFFASPLFAHYLSPDSALQAIARIVSILQPAGAQHDYRFRYDRDLHGRPWRYWNRMPSRQALPRERDARRRRQGKSARPVRRGGGRSAVIGLCFSTRGLLFTLLGANLTLSENRLILNASFKEIEAISKLGRE